ncbi:MAG: DUF5671 domain-containing protein, partial [Candidatus Yonathbacteria bacterium]|nr:DUF5671 domain-containing protein [Candidatus Yonathbacteria bacterium]
TPKDFFLHLGAIVALYISIISVLTLLFEIINQLYPQPFGYTDPYASGVSLAMAMLIVAFPLYILFMRVLSGVEKSSPEKRELSVRKWLIYLTLFLAGVVIAIDLIVLIQKFFAGEEITLAFALKVFSIIVVLAAVFGYYLYDIKHNQGEGTKMNTLFAYGASTFAVLAIVIGFLVMGSPYTQREKRFDAERVAHLQSIQYQVVYYWQSKEKLPVTLDDLKDPISGFVLPMDPATNAPYEYTPKGELSFQLCATFSKETPTGAGLQASEPMAYPYKSALDENWQHGMGRVCFDRTIDPELYPPRSVTEKALPAVR